MKRLFAPIALCALCACGGGRGPILRGPGQADVVAAPPPAPPAVPADANFVLALAEAVPSPEADVPSYALVFVDGKEVGRTETGPKSQEKRWGGNLVPSNHLFRFQVFTSTAPESWIPLAEAWQPPERFIRVEQGLRTTAVLKLTDEGRKHTLQVRRDPPPR